MAKCRAILFAFTAITVVVSDNLFTSASPSKQCLQCICEASSGCKPNIRCHNTGNGQYFCGPYQISWAYWADAGKPGSTGFSNDFENCLVDKNCAEAAVRGYMAKWGADCNGDSQVDCFDYAAIHKTGPGGCNQQWLLNSKYWSDFKQCYTGSSATNRGIGFRPLSAASAPFAVSPSISSTSSFRASSNPSNTIIEIPKPQLPPLSPPGSLSHSSAISTSSASVGPSFSSFSSSSSFSRHNFSHSEVEITESVTSNADSVSSSNRIPAIPSAINNPFTSVPPLHVFRPNLNPLHSLPAPIPLPSPANKPQASHPTLFQSLPRPPANFNPIVPGDCLECLCQASSKCNLNKGCDGAYCGPYLLSWGYWADSGSPGNGANYPSCANNRTCAELAVQGYMNKWQKDCNNDGVIDCTDYALIHKLGPHACGKVEAIQVTDYWKQFDTCRGPSEVENRDRNPIVISSVSSNSFPDVAPNRFSSSPLNPEIEVEEVEQPLAPRSVPVASNPEVRISFNNREIVNTNRPPQSESLVPPATIHHRPALPPPIPLPTSRPLPPSETNVNSNVISNSPLSRPTFSNAPPNPAIAPSNQPSSSLFFKPSTTEAPFVEVSPSSLNDDFFANSRANESPIGAALPPSFSSSATEPPTRSEHLSDRTMTEPRAAGNFSSSTSNSLVPQDCLECICHASSRCNNAAGCVSDGSGKFICGPFQVDWEYWTEAGKPGQRSDLSNLENFQQCLQNRQCADDTVRGYMGRFRKDCTEDGVIDCNDMAAIHIAGPNNCNAQWYLDSQYYSDFRSCYDFRRR